MAGVAIHDDDLPSRLQSLGINQDTTTQDIEQDANTENAQIHPYLLNPSLKGFNKYISPAWYESEDDFLDLREASEIQLNDRVIYSLHQYLEDETKGARLYRIACADFAEWDASIWRKVHPEVRKKFRKVLAEGGILMDNNGPLPERLEGFIQEGLAALEADGSEASVRSPVDKGKRPANTINKGKQPVDPIDNGKRIEALHKRTDALLNDRLDPNHPMHLGQSFDDSGNSVHTDKASFRTRAHRYYQIGQHKITATAGPSNQNDTGLQRQEQHEYQQQARPQQSRTQTHDTTRHTQGPDNHHHNGQQYQQQQHAGTYAHLGQQNFQGQQQTAGPPGSYGIS
ncbi:hypothetical protein E4U58_001861, partial [Claviceps cyperi]